MQRFWEKVRKTENCWLWQGSVTSDGYGRFHMSGKTHSAHRIAYMLRNGMIEDDLHVLHKCDNPPCVNPAHLYLGDHYQNMQDKKMRGHGK